MADTACLHRAIHNDKPDPGPGSEQEKEKEKEGLRTVWGMLDHDLCHAGELALMLGVLGFETPEF